MHNSTSAPADGEVRSPETEAILICADASHASAYGRTITEAAPNCKIVLISDSQEIVPRLSQGGFQLLLLDLETAGLNAVQTMHGLRKLISGVDLPVLAIVGAHASERRNAVLAAGANDYVTSPLDPLETSIRIRNQLDLRRTHQSHYVLHKNLECEIKGRTAKLDLLINSGLMMSMERSRAKLLQYILTEGQKLLNCDGGTMYLVTAQKALRFAERTREDYLPYLEIPLYDPETGQANDHYASSYAAIHKKTVRINDVYRETQFDWSGTKDFDAKSHYRTVSLLTVPMAPRNAEVIGVLQFINALDGDSGGIIPFPDDAIPLVEALASQAAVAVDNLQLVEGQKAMTEDVIRTIAAAVDAKSPHTGRHCVQVPELAQMLAEAACSETSGPLADFHFQTDDEWFEFRIGAWLHDCGKIVTPEHIIDKATKLDMIYNRIHEIRTRFEVLLRDAEIKRLETLLNGGDKAEADALFEQQKTALLNDFAFIAECNLGSELMDPAHIERIKAIAATTWLRHFDDSLGLSQEEMQRRLVEPREALPAREFLLADNTHHVIPRASYQFPPANLGLKMAIPENLYNNGEIYNLSVQKGTLTFEDRFKINEHIIETIKMLDHLPFPDYLRRIPEYAATHHETLDGRGYPRRLRADELSIPARIMAIADIFEALTAADRPYKTPNKLSEAIQILHKMKQDRHIDADLFDLFLTSGIYLRYAEKYLAADQIDEVDIRPFLGAVN